MIEKWNPNITLKGKIECTCKMCKDIKDKCSNMKIEEFEEIDDFEFYGCHRCRQQKLCSCKTCIHDDQCICIINDNKQHVLDQKVDGNGKCVHYEEEWIKVLKLGRGPFPGNLRFFKQVLHGPLFKGKYKLKD